MQDRKSQQLEDEVASMLEMAETVSSGVMERLSEVSSEDGSLRGSGSREKLLASPEVHGCKGSYRNCEVEEVLVVCGPKWRVEENGPLAEYNNRSVDLHTSSRPLY